MGGRDAPLSSEGIPIHATLRAAPDEAVNAPALARESEASPPSPAAGPAQPVEETAPDAQSDRREPVDVVSIPGAYVDARQLTELPRPLEEPPLHLLQSIVARAGVARLMLYIDQSGRVTSVEVDSTTLPPEATERAVAVFSGVRFSPGRIGSLAVRSRIPVTVGAEERIPGD